MIKRNLFDTDRNYDKESFSQSITYSSYSDDKFDIDCSNPASNTNKVLSPVKILNVPNLQDDFYLNTMDWHPEGPIAIALKD